MYLSPFSAGSDALVVIQSTVRISNNLVALVKAPPPTPVVIASNIIFGTLSLAQLPNQVPALLNQEVVIFSPIFPTTSPTRSPVKFDPVKAAIWPYKRTIAAEFAAIVVVWPATVTSKATN